MINMQYFNQIHDIFNSKRLLSINLSAVIFLGIFCGQHLFSQQITEQVRKFNSNNIREELYTRTDRDIYFTGEQLWFKVYKLNNLNSAPWDISKVVYIELLDKNNFPLKQLKVFTDGSSGSSVLRVPENISSGNYVLRAYTNWMKNLPADFYFYTTISVINPFENIDNLKLLSSFPVKDTIDALSRLLTGSNSLNNISKKYEADDGSKHINYTITCQKPDYSKRDGVKIIISAADMAGNPVESDLSVSVTRSDLVYSSDQSRIPDLNTIRDSSEMMVDPVYLPEMEGHFISGFIRSKATGDVLKNTDISLSFVGKTARCQFSKTDENGEFYFVVTSTGLNEIVIQPLIADNNGYFVELNQPFSNKFIQRKPVSFYLDTSMIDGINDAIVSMQINNIYESFRQKQPEVPIIEVPDFFGEPENTIIMSDFIELTSLREVVKEIIPNVYTLKQNGEYDFKLINKFRGQPFENKPLLLVDGVPIYNVEKVLNIASKEIEKADITNTRYFFSEHIFDGIVSFVTKKGNLSAMEFDNSIFRQVFEGCQDKIFFYSPDYSTELLKESRIPDFRNTLYWNPDLRTGKDGKTEVEFFTSDESVEYSITVEGMSSDGKAGVSTTTLIVK